jgi:hypothetical protein
MLITPSTPPPQNEVTAITKNNIALWGQCYSMGNAAHQQQQFTKAVTYFKKCIDLCTELSRQAPIINHTKTLPEMLHQASHNLAACHNAMGRGLLAKKVLKKLHDQFIRVASCSNQLRSIRLEVLANIDQSLFSLTSQLAYLNQLEAIHPNIVKPENVVTAASRVLLRDSYSASTNHSTLFTGIAPHNNALPPEDNKMRAIR